MLWVKIWENYQTGLFTWTSTPFLPREMLLAPGTPILEQYGYVPPESPPLFALAAPKDSTFSACAAWKDPPLKKIYTFLCYFLAPKPLFSRVGQIWKPPFSVWGRSLSPLFLNPSWHIFTTFIFEYPPPPHPGYWPLLFAFCQHNDSYVAK